MLRLSSLPLILISPTASAFTEEAKQEKSKAAQEKLPTAPIMGEGVVALGEYDKYCWHTITTSKAHKHTLTVNLKGTFKTAFENSKPQSKDGKKCIFYLSVIDATPLYMR